MAFRRAPKLLLIQTEAKTSLIKVKELSGVKILSKAIGGKMNITELAVRLETPNHRICAEHDKSKRNERWVSISFIRDKEHTFYVNWEQTLRQTLIDLYFNNSSPRTTKKLCSFACEKLHGSCNEVLSLSLLKAKELEY